MYNPDIRYFELIPIHTSQISFHNRANIIIYYDFENRKTRALYSYNTNVMRITETKSGYDIVLIPYSTSTRTTNKHITEELKQNIYCSMELYKKWKAGSNHFFVSYMEGLKVLDV